MVIPQLKSTISHFNQRKAPRNVHITPAAQAQQLQRGRLAKTAYRAGCIRSVPCHRPSLAPQIQFTSTPSHSTNIEAYGAGELLLGDKPVDRGSAQASQLHDGWHA